MHCPTSPLNYSFLNLFSPEEQEPEDEADEDLADLVERIVEMLYDNGTIQKNGRWPHPTRKRLLAAFVLSNLNQNDVPDETVSKKRKLNK